MEKKKYVLKNKENIEVKAADGTENSEHIFDMIARAEMTLDNIKDNTDLCINFFKLADTKGEMDNDELDALSLICEEAITLECASKEDEEKINIIKEKLSKNVNVKEGEVEELLKNILINELHSKEIVDKVFKQK